MQICDLQFNHKNVRIAIFGLTHLKVSTNEKRGGLKVVAFDRYPFKVFSLRFLKKGKVSEA